MSSHLKNGFGVFFDTSEHMVVLVSRGRVLRECPNRNFFVPVRDIALRCRVKQERVPRVHRDVDHLFGQKHVRRLSLLENDGRVDNVLARLNPRGRQ